jgi:hypothetical protein
MMKKLILVVLAVFLMSGIASAATTLEMSGYMRITPEMNNFNSASGSGALQPAPSFPRESGTQAFTDQRTRLYFNIKSNENVGAQVATELQAFWGGGSNPTVPTTTSSTTGLVTTNTSSPGGGLQADTTSFLLKSANMWFKMGDLKITAGMMSYLDDMSGIFSAGGDMSGFKADYTLSRSASFQTGVFTWWDPENRKTDSVMFIPLAIKQQLGSGTGTLFFYTIQDHSNGTVLSSPTVNGRGGRPLTTATTTAGVTTTTAAYDNAQIYYAGLNYGGKAGNISYSAFGVYNFGTFKNFDNTGYAAAGTQIIGDASISAIAANLKVDVKIGAGKLRFNSLYVSEVNYATQADKFRGFVLGEHYGGGIGNPLLQEDVLILINNTDAINYGGFLTPNVANNGDGIQLAYLAYDHQVLPKINVKGVLGYAAADKDNSQYAAAASRKNGKGIGTEMNGQLRYDFDSNLSIKAVYSYLMLGDYYKYAAPADSPDNLWRTQIKFIYSF